MKLLLRKISDLITIYEKSEIINLKQSEMFLSKSQKSRNFPAARFFSLAERRRPVFLTRPSFERERKDYGIAHFRLGN